MAPGRPRGLADDVLVDTFDSRLLSHYLAGA
jgi:hypothetical protein